MNYLLDALYEKIGLIVFVALLCYTSYELRKEKRKNEKLQLEIKALKKQ